MTVTSEILRADNDTRDMLWPFDFAVTDNEGFGSVWFDTAPLRATRQAGFIAHSWCLAPTSWCAATTARRRHRCSADTNGNRWQRA